MHHGQVREGAEAESMLMWGLRANTSPAGQVRRSDVGTHRCVNVPGVFMVRNIAIFVCLSLAVVPAGAAVLFQDSFDTAPDDAWVVPNGGWQWSDGRFLNTASCGFQTCMSPLFIGRPDWTDATLKLDFTPVSGGVIYLLVGMNAPSLFETGATSGWCLDMGWGDHAGILYGGSSPAGQELVSDWTGLWHLSVGVTYTIEFGKAGDQAFARIYPAGTTAPDWQLRVMDPRPSAGWCGFSTWATTGYLDNVVVTGNGVVPVEAGTWGGVKALYR